MKDEFQILLKDERGHVYTPTGEQLVDAAYWKVMQTLSEIFPEKIKYSEVEHNGMLEQRYVFMRGEVDAEND